MARIAVIVDDWFEDSEFVEPVKAFLKAGHEVIRVGLKKGSIVEGKKVK
ncbi:MAG: protease, partial [Elusimicrobia bacterium]|nr:protease [Elusimicrobiota bacterium]